MPKYLLFAIALLLCLTPFVSSAVALIMGVILASMGAIPSQMPVTKLTKHLLAFCVVGLGFGVQLEQAIQLTKNSAGLIIGSIFLTMALGWILAKTFRLQKETGYLISVGTAICGGSAIAAVSPSIRAKDTSIAIALGCVFLMNSVALFVFPVVGHALSLSQLEFGIWAAIAIHDTSSVVGAASAYGQEALTTATTLKLARALWILPVVFISAFLFRGDSKKLTIPLFIVFYLAVVWLSDALPEYQLVYQSIFSVAKQGLVVSLFLVGCSLSFKQLFKSGRKPLAFAASLWLVISTLSLIWIVRMY